MISHHAEGSVGIRAGTLPILMRMRQPDAQHKSRQSSQETDTVHSPRHGSLSWINPSGVTLGDGLANSLLALKDKALCGKLSQLDEIRSQHLNRQARRRREHDDTRNLRTRGRSTSLAGQEIESDLADEHEQHILRAWHENAAAWAQAVRDKRIESRQRVTDGAIVDAVLSCRPGAVLDVGCGEGWLVRALAAHRVAAIGVDVVPALIEAARKAGGGHFHLTAYDGLGDAGFAPVDAVICNFSLLGKESAAAVFEAAPRLLRPAGTMIVQTLHPAIACGDQPYRDGWRTGSWAGLGDGFADPPPWYFRTLESWQRLFEDNGLRILELREPRHPDTGEPASALFIAERR